MITLATVWLIKIGMEKQNQSIPVGSMWAIAVLSDIICVAIVFS